MDLKDLRIIKESLLHLQKIDWILDDHLRSRVRITPRSLTDWDLRIIALFIVKLDTFCKLSLLLQKEMWSDLEGWIFNCQFKHQFSTISRDSCN